MPGPTDARATASPPTNFIRQIVIDDLRSGKHGGRVITRFPPEPNGHLHLGHAKSICLNFGIASEFQGACHLRFDDTNPTKEDVEYEESIRESVRWLGFDWGAHLYYASDYYDRLYEFAEHFVRTGRAYVDSLSAEEIREFRGTLTEAGRESPFRDRAPEESLDLFRRMRAGEFADGAHVLRLRIDMASPNINMRDPVIYRIRKVAHHRTGDRWCVYPLYDYAHSISDAIERITHSICTLEFQDHRPLYDWIVEELARDGLLSRPLPQQYEFARGNLTYTVMSKRKLLQLVNEGHVTGWDDPRMPTLVGIRRLGYTPESIRTFWERAGVTKSDSVIDIAVLEECVREDLNARAQRAMAVLRPLRVVIENYPDDRVEECAAPNHPQKPERGKRTMPFCRELWIERDDFAENPPKGYFRLAPGAEVRLRFAYIVRCERVVKDAAGNVVELRCSYDPDTRSGTAGAEARKIKGNIHWVSARHAVDAEIRLYDRLFGLPNPDAAEGGFLSCLNPRSIEILRHAKLEPMLGGAVPQSRFQFERNGYFCVDPIESRPGALVFNRTATLKDPWTKSGA